MKTDNSKNKSLKSKDVGGTQNQKTSTAMQPATAEEEPERMSQASTIVDIVLKSHVELFRSPDGECYASVKKNYGRDTLQIKSEQFKHLLGELYYRTHGSVASKSAIDDAGNTLFGRTQFDGEERPVFTRLAEIDGTIYLDLCDADRHAIKITGDGWNVVRRPSVRFLRPSGMLPLPTPVRGGNIDELRGFINVSDEDWPLYLAWMVVAMQTSRPMPVLVVQGEQGSAKSTLCRLTRSLMDPNMAPLRSPPRSEQDLLIAATNGSMIVLENVSWLSGWLSDALCRISTGAALGTRKLYSDGGETLFSARRPIMVNSISHVVTRSDLLDRSITISLEPISPSMRRTEKVLLAEFELVRPKLLGALLDAVAAALCNEETVPFEKMPRMADAFRFAVAAEPALGLEHCDIVSAFRANRKRAAEAAIDNCIISQPLLNFMKHKSEWRGTATGLIAALQPYAEGTLSASRAWPRLPQYLSNLLRRIAPDLREHGIDVHFERTAESRQIRMNNRNYKGKVKTAKKLT